MKILAIADKECAALWDNYRPGSLADYGLILSSGDLNAKYMSFLVTMGRCPLVYVHGNHDGGYKYEPPEGCDCADDKLIVYKGLRILGLGGSRRYSGGAHQYTERQMQRRIRRLRRAVKLAGGVDIVLTHAAPLGAGDAEDMTHRGFEAFLKFIDAYHPRYLIHGHVHLNYGFGISRLSEYGGTKVINCFERHEFDCEPVCGDELSGRAIRTYARLFVKNLVFLD